MKVERPGRVDATGSKSAKKSAAGGAKFQVAKPATEQATTSVSGLGPVAAVDALLAAQEAGSESGRRKSKGYRTGEEMLDLLQSVQSGLLMGGIPVANLKRLKVLVSQNQGAEADSKLKQILEDIELRVAVELAKLGYDQ
jgi:hypothetical protein